MAAGRRSHVCNACGTSYTKRHNLERHVREQHAPDTADRHVCDRCGQVLPRRYRLEAHVATWHAAGAEERFRCSLCPATWSTRAGLARHVRSHATTAGGSDEACVIRDVNAADGRRGIACPDCGRMFSHYWRMKLHWRRHAGARHTCPVCRQMFRQRGALVAHVRRQHGEQQQLPPVEPPPPQQLSGDAEEEQLPELEEREKTRPNCGHPKTACTSQMSQQHQPSEDLLQQLNSVQPVDLVQLQAMQLDAVAPPGYAVQLDSVEVNASQFGSVPSASSQSNPIQLTTAQLHSCQSDLLQLGPAQLSSPQLDSVEQLLDASQLDADLLAAGVRVEVESRCGGDETVMLITLVDDGVGQ